MKRSIEPAADNPRSRRKRRLRDRSATARSEREQDERSPKRVSQTSPPSHQPSASPASNRRISLWIALPSDFFIVYLRLTISPYLSFVNQEKSVSTAKTADWCGRWIQQNSLGWQKTAVACFLHRGEDAFFWKWSTIFASSGAKRQ